MSEIFQSCACFGLLLAMGSFQLARAINKLAGKEVCNPLLFATLLCGAVLLGTGTEYDVFYDNGGNILEFFLTPATICLAIPLYKQFELLKKNAGAVLAGCAAGVAAHMAGCALMLVLFRMEAAEYISLLPKSITTAIGMGVSEEAGGIVTLTVISIIVTGIVGNICAEMLCRLAGIIHPVAKGLAIGTSAHAVGTAKALELGEIEGAMSSLSIAVAGLLTVVVVPLAAGLL